ncbi:CvpA family protein [Pseudoflavonifractor sp. 60]|uniref:CvpA family protein n=1 Tax=Pseudoflavonifractor sp. 60 TaxID=2304576 RepID=UPI001371F83D|nr:CvpA family protein [Pseudoflavonifractor sp. 60]NBI66624.1 CvpA family protein [Pseudoflavonifractor sp. 60]
MDPITLDLIAAALLLFFLWRGYRKGFVLTLCGFLAVFVALIGASILSNALAEPVAKAVEPAIEQRIQDVLTEAIRNTEFTAVGGGVAQTPEELSLAAVIQQLKESRLYHSFADAFQTAVDSGMAEMTSNAAQTLAHFVAVQIARTVIFALAFFAVLIAWFFLSRALDLVTRLPVLNSVNRWGGGAIGLCKGALIVMIAAWLLQDSYLPRAAVEETFLLKFLCSVTPLSFFL